MKKILSILPMLIILLIYARTIEAVEIQEKPLLNEVSSENLKRTKFTPVLDTPINTDENLIYCSTFQNAWNQLCDKYANGTLEMENAPDYVEKLNALYKQAPLISDDSALAVAGTGKKILSKINRTANKKFRRLNKNEQPPKLNVPIKSDEIVILSYLYKNINFKIPFEKTNPIGMWTEGIKKGRFFYADTLGYDRWLSEPNKDEKDYSGQISLLYFDESKYRAIIKLTDKSMSDEIVISNLPVQTTLEKTYKNINDLIVSSRNKKNINDIHTVEFPKINFNIIHEYQPLLNNKIFNKRIQNYKIKKAIQKIVFRINDGGKFVFRIRRQHIYFDNFLLNSRIYIGCPFVIFIKNKLNDMPHFGAYVANYEILEESTFDRYGEYDDEIKHSGYFIKECSYYQTYFSMWNDFRIQEEYEYKGKNGTNLLLLALKKKEHIKSRLTAIYKEQSYKVEKDTLSVCVEKRYNGRIESIARKVNVNDSDNLGITPLICAVETDDYEMVQLLLKLGANPALKRKDGKDAMTIAKDKKNEKIIKLLFKQ